MSNDQVTDYECAICLQRCHHPTQLPCGHVFCFLCVKGVAIQNKKCAMCRATIPPNYLDNPVLLEKLSTQLNTETDQEYQWYYEGRNGWWKYDERSNIELETTFNAGETECSLLLAGALYNIDFQSMTQIRRSDPTRRRHVRRDTPLLPAKGIAGIKTSASTEMTKHENESSSVNVQIVSVSHEIASDGMGTPDDNSDVIEIPDDNSDVIEIPEDNSDVLEIPDDNSDIQIVDPQLTSNQYIDLTNIFNNLSVTNLAEAIESEDLSRENI